MMTMMLKVIGVKIVMITVTAASFALPMTVMKTIIVASFALPMVSNATFEATHDDDHDADGDRDGDCEGIYRHSFVCVTKDCDDKYLQ